MTGNVEPMQAVAWLEGVLARGPVTFEELSTLFDRAAISSSLKPR